MIINFYILGGMLTIRLCLDHPDIFRACVLIGPLIYPGPSRIMRSLPMSTIMPHVNNMFQRIFGEYLDTYRLGNLLHVCLLLLSLFMSF